MANLLFPRVLVGCPTCNLKEDSLERFIQGINSLTYPHMDVVIEDNSPTPAYAEKLKQYGHAFEKNNPGKTFRVIYSGSISPKARERLVNGRNKIREIARAEKYDYFLSLEQDVVPPHDSIETLLARDKDIISGAYLNKKHEGNRVNLIVMAGIWGSEEEKQKGLVRSMGILQLFPARVMEVAYAGMGCMLISRRVLEQVSFRYDEANLASDDVYFCQDAREKGFSTFVDSSVLCAHHFNDAFKKTEY